MPENINVTYLGDVSVVEEDDDRPTMVEVDHVSMVFNIANERLNSLKEYFIALIRHQLRFREFYALDDVSFEVKKGDVFGILGTNGSGKSTMLKIVAGVLDPTKGDVRIHGNIAPLIELGAGFDMELTARENVYLNGALLGYSKKFIADHFDEIVDFAEVRDFLDMPLKNYSSGMVARIAFSIATMIVPEILIVDEVLSVGDFMFQQKCERRISDLIKNHGVTVLIVSHSNDQIERLCNKAIWIEKGHTRMLGSASDVCRAYRIVGGRTGSEESEKRVIEMMTRRYHGTRDVIDMIAGDTRYSTVVLAAEEYIDDQEDLIMVGGDARPDCMLATGLAGLTNAVILNTLRDMIPTITYQTIKRIDPKRVVIVGDEGQVGEEVRSKLAEQLDVEGVRRFDDADFTRRSLDVYEYGLQRAGSWGEVAVVAYADSTAGLISLAPLIYEVKAPVLFASPADESLNERIVGILGQGFDRIIAIEEGAPLPDSIIAALDRLNGEDCKVTRFSCDDPRQMNLQIDYWIDQLRAADGFPALSKIVAAPTWNPIDAYLVGPYSSKTKSQILMYSPIDLDDVSETFDYINAKQGAIEKVTFLGGSAFNDDDQEVLGKAILAAQGKEELHTKKRSGRQLRKITVYDE